MRFFASFAKTFAALKKILPLFSYVFHPIFIPLFGALLYFKLNEHFFVIEQVYLILIQISIIMVFIPICFFYLLRTLGKVDSVMLSEVSQRKIPLAIQVLLIGILIFKSITPDVLPELYYFFLGGLASTVSALLLSFLRVKASLHLMGTVALLAFAIGLSMHNQANAIYHIALLVAANGLVAASRLEMNAHTEMELVIGTLCGLLPQLALWYFWL
jgi:hypothetical protein